MIKFFAESCNDLIEEFKHATTGKIKKSIGKFSRVLHLINQLINFNNNNLLIKK